MQASPDFNDDTAFDSFLILKDNCAENHTLTLVLKIHLNQLSPLTIPLPFGHQLRLPFADADGTNFGIRPWTPAEFATFKQAFLRQCTHWNDKFWLTPPVGFTALDYKFGARTVHPNIYCHLFVSIAGSAAGSHRTIDVVNLDKSAAAHQLGKKVSDLNASDFRSTSVTYDSLDTKAVPLPFTDQAGHAHRVRRSTIAHEIGHALGLPHSGVSHPAPLCSFAMLADSLPPAFTAGASFPALFKGSTNSSACYGSSGPANLGLNVMGYGLEFDETNAKPWLDRIALHTGTSAGDWKVSVQRRVPPKIT